MKCLVCGEIFDASLEICPICGVGKGNFIPVDSAPAAPQRKDTTERFVILGGGTAAYHAAKSIRERNATASIHLVTNEDALPYNRTMLTKQMLADLNGETLALAPRSWYESAKITVQTGVSATALDAKAKQVTLSDGSTLPYDKLIYALGATGFVPPVPGSDLPHTVTLRNLKDISRTLELAKTAREAVVIGGGVLGLEAAWALKQSGLQVTVLEALPHIMNRQLDGDTSTLLAGKVRAKGITLMEGVQVSGIEPDCVTLKDGTRLPAQLVVFSCGVRPNVSLAEAAGAAVDRGVTVDHLMRTTLPDVYACGDCARFGGISYALWAEASDMGRTAGANAAGEELSYTAIAAALTFHGMDTALYVLGDCGKESKESYVTIKLDDEEKGMYERYFFLHGKMTGCILVGQSDKIARATQWVANGVSIQAILP